MNQKNKLLKKANYHRKEIAQLLQKGDLFHLLELNKKKKKKTPGNKNTEGC